MARNKITDLNDHLFAQLERLGDETIPEGEMELEIKKAKAMSGIASQIIKSNKVIIDAMRLVSSGSISQNQLPETIGLKQL